MPYGISTHSIFSLCKKSFKLSPQYLNIRQSHDLLCNDHIIKKLKNQSNAHGGVKTQAGTQRSLLARTITSHKIRDNGREAHTPCLRKLPLFSCFTRLFRHFLFRYFRSSVTPAKELYTRVFLPRGLLHTSDSIMVYILPPFVKCFTSA